MAFLRNCWYVAAWDDEVGKDELFRRTLLNEPLGPYLVGGVALGLVAYGYVVFGRFTHMGIDPYAFVSALNGIWAQRLIRMNCPRCGEQHDLP